MTRTVAGLEPHIYLWWCWMKGGQINKINNTNKKAGRCLPFLGTATIPRNGKIETRYCTRLDNTIQYNKLSFEINLFKKSSILGGLGPNDHFWAFRPETTLWTISWSLESCSIEAQRTVFDWSQFRSKNPQISSIFSFKGFVGIWQNIWSCPRTLVML